MISVSKSLAKKYGADGVLVNSVLPGLIHTSMWERAATEIAEAMGSTMMDVINNNGKNVPLGRYGTAEEVAAVIAFLCSNAASYVNGISMEVDGGQGVAVARQSGELRPQRVVNNMAEKLAKRVLNQVEMQARQEKMEAS